MLIRFLREYCCKGCTEGQWFVLSPLGEKAGSNPHCFFSVWSFGPVSLATCLGIIPPPPDSSRDRLQQLYDSKKGFSRFRKLLQTQEVALPPLLTKAHHWTCQSSDLWGKNWNQTWQNYFLILNTKIVRNGLDESTIFLMHKVEQNSVLWSVCLSAASPKVFFRPSIPPVCIRLSACSFLNLQSLDSPLRAKWGEWMVKRGHGRSTPEAFLLLLKTEQPCGETQMSLNPYSITRLQHVKGWFQTVPQESWELGWYSIWAPCLCDCEEVMGRGGVCEECSCRIRTVTTKTRAQRAGGFWRRVMAMSHARKTANMGSDDLCFLCTSRGNCVATARR